MNLATSSDIFETMRMRELPYVKWNTKKPANHAGTEAKIELVNKRFKRLKEENPVKDWNKSGFNEVVLHIYCRQNVMINLTNRWLLFF